MKSSVRYFGLGLSLYLLFLIALFPAGQAYRFAGGPLSAAAPEMKLAGFDGSVWSGQVEKLVYRDALLGQASWQLSPLSLLFGKASLKALLQSEDGYLQADVNTALTGGDVKLVDLEGRLPVGELTRMAPYLPLVLDGTIALDMPVLVVERGGRILAAEGKAIWHQAAITAPQALSLGDLQLVLRTEDEGRVVGEVSDRGGPLRVAGTVQFSPDATYRFNGTVAAGAEAPPELRQSLGWLGKPDAQGRYQLNYSGKL